MSLTPIADLGIALKADVDDYHKSMASASDATRSITGLFRNLGATVRNTGVIMTASSAIIGGAMFSLARRAENVNAAFREVDSISSQVSDTQEEYGDLVSELNTEFGLQANRLQVIDALYQSVSAGVEEGEQAQREFLETAADLAVVGLVDLETSVDVLSTSLNAYGLETEDATRVSEALFRTVQFGKVTLDELAPVMGRVTALGSEMNTEIEELGAVMAVLTRTGFEARIAATGLRAVLRGMMRPSDTMKEVLRDIALENEDIARQWNEQSQLGDDLAQQYRDTASAVRELEQAQKEARRSVEEHSLAIQEARLMQSAIEQDRVDEVEDLVREEIAQMETIEELDDFIEEHQFNTNAARVEEEQHRMELEEKKDVLEDLRDDFAQNVDIQGDLEDGTGQLVLAEQDLIETLVQLRERADEMGIGFDELFPRTRGLQAALALVGDNGQTLTEIFEAMEDGTFNAEEAWADLDQEMRDDFGTFEDFKNEMQEIQETDLEQWADDMRGPQEQLRNATSRVSEAAQDLGQVFNEDVTNALQNFSRSIERITRFANNMEDSLRENISQFMILAVTLGLVLGPLLLIGGQLVMIASSLGVGLLPVLTVLSGVFGTLATSMNIAVSGGERAEEMFRRMSGVFDTVRYILRSLLNIFRVIILPELLEFGEALFSLFDAISEAMDGATGPGGDLEQMLMDIANAFADGISALTEWLQANEELIAEGIAKLVHILTSEAIPNLLDFLRGILSVVAGIDPRPFIALAGVIAMISVVVFRLVGIIGRWLQRNGEIIGSLLTWIGVVVGAGMALLKLVTFVGQAAIVIGNLLPLLSSWIVFITRLLMAKNTLAAVVNVLAFKGFPALAKGISVLLGPVGLLIAGIGLLVTAWYKDWMNMRGIVSAVIQFIIDHFMFMLDFAFLIPRMFLAFWRDGFSGVFDVIRDLFVDLYGLVFESGANIVLEIAEGIKSGLGTLKDSMSSVGDVVLSHLPTSPAKAGPLANNPPGDSGRTISEDIAAGMKDGEGEIEESVSSITDQDFGFDFEDPVGDIEDTDAFRSMGGKPSDIGSGESGMGSMPQKGNDITIEEGAIKVGPFEGIADEEIPKKVRKEVDYSFDKILDDLEAKGIEVSG